MMAIKDPKQLRDESYKLVASLGLQKVGAAVRFLRSRLSTDDVKFWAKEINKDAYSWWAKPHGGDRSMGYPGVSFHMNHGMAIRNLLRGNGFSEAYFGVENLDDIYIPLFEAAVKNSLGESHDIRFPEPAETKATPNDDNEVQKLRRQVEAQHEALRHWRQKYEELSGRYVAECNRRVQLTILLGRVHAALDSHNFTNLAEKVTDALDEMRNAD